jgi:hypothetical protein
VDRSQLAGAFRAPLRRGSVSEPVVAVAAVARNYTWVGLAVTAWFATAVCGSAFIATLIAGDSLTISAPGSLRWSLVVCGILLGFIACVSTRVAHSEKPLRRSPSERALAALARLAPGHEESVLPRRWRRPVGDGAMAPQIPAPPDDAQISWWAGAITRRYDKSELSMSARLILNPRRFVARAVQSVEPHDLSISHTVSRDVRLPGPFRSTQGGKRCLLPVLTVPKGSLVDALDVEVDSKNGHALSYRHSQGAALWLVDLLARNAGCDLDERMEIARSVANTSAVPPPTVQATERDVRDAFSVDEVQRWVNLLSGHRLVFAEVAGDTGSTCSVRVSWVSAANDRFTKANDSLRTFLGLGPTSFSGRVVGGEADSWHLRVQAPEGCHITRVSLRLPADGSADDFDVLHNGIVGKELAHLRVRRHKADSLAAFRVNISETPPGIGGPISVLAFALAATVWVVGSVFDRIFVPFPPPTTGGPAESAITAGALLSGIAAASAWLISRFTDSAVRRAQVREVLMLFSIFVFSFVAVSSVALRKQFALSGPYDLELAGSLVRLNHPLWAGLMVLTGAMAFFAVASLFLRAWILRGDVAAGSARSF